MQKILKNKKKLQNLSPDTAMAKRNIMQAAQKAFKAKFNVICSKADFSYVAHTKTFCQITNDDITCYAFQAF